MSSDQHFHPSYKTCTEVSAQCPVSATTYGYYPELGPNAFFSAWFGILLIAGLAVGVKTKTWSYTAFLCVGLLGEFLGYIGRIMMHDNPWNTGAFEMQICCLVLSPSFIAGSIYLTAKHLVLYGGPQYSRLRPNLYPWVFVGCDWGSIILQACGGGIAASAGQQNSAALLDAGNGLIVAGIAFQVFTMSVCGILVLDFGIRFWRATSQKKAETSNTLQTGYETDRNDTRKMLNLKIFMGAVILAYLTVLIRCIYRIPEMAGGVRFCKPGITRTFANI